jgi:hypothetical protein
MLECDADLIGAEAGSQQLAYSPIGMGSVFEHTDDCEACWKHHIRSPFNEFWTG